MRAGSPSGLGRKGWAALTAVCTGSSKTPGRPSAPAAVPRAAPRPDRAGCGLHCPCGWSMVKALLAWIRRSSRASGCGTAHSRSSLPAVSPYGRRPEARTGRCSRRTSVGRSPPQHDRARSRRPEGPPGRRGTTSSSRLLSDPVGCTATWSVSYTAPPDRDAGRGVCVPENPRPAAMSIPGSAAAAPGSEAEAAFTSLTVSRLLTRRTGTARLHPGSQVQPGGRSRGLHRTRSLHVRRGLGPAGPPARLVILPPWRKLAALGAPAPHHQLPEQLNDTHLARPRAATHTTATITVVTAMATITARPCHALGRRFPRARLMALL
jgi:hypothetical protein